MLAQEAKRDDNVISEIPVRKMSQEQIQNRRRTTINNIAEKEMFGIQSKNYKKLNIKHNVN